MVKRGKSINLYLVDGSTRGTIKCTIANWTGLAYKIRRKDLENCKKINFLNQSGVYLLFGKSENEINKDTVYIGQAGSRKNGKGLLGRLQEHNLARDESYWNEAICLTTANNSFGPTEISYLESSFYALAVKSNRYIVMNNNDPRTGNITEEKESELLDFIDYAKIVTGVLGHKVFEELVERESTTKLIEEDNKLYFKNTNDKYDAVGLITEDGFVVLKDSKINVVSTNSCRENIKNYRDNAKVSKQGILEEDVLLTSPSAAAGFVAGASMNGLVCWVNSKGIILKKMNI